MATEKLNLTLKVWRQANTDAKGHIETYDAKDIPTTASFLEMLDIVNEGIIEAARNGSIHIVSPSLKLRMCT